MPELTSVVQRAQGGDIEAYTEIVRRCQHFAYGYAYSLLGDFSCAEDAAQEAFIEAYRDLRSCGSLRRSWAGCGASCSSTATGKRAGGVTPSP